LALRTRLAKRCDIRSSKFLPKLRSFRGGFRTAPLVIHLFLVRDSRLGLVHLTPGKSLRCCWELFASKLKAN